MINLLNLFKYSLVGGICALIDIAFFYFTYEFLNLNLFLSISISFIIATILNYFISIKFVFESGIRFQKKFTEFSAIISVSAIGLLLNLCWTFLFINLFNISSLVSKILAVIIVFTWNYMLRRYYIFS